MGNLTGLIESGRSHVTQFLNFAIDFLVPLRCVNCNVLVAKQAAICPDCWKQVRFIDRPFCEIMGTPFSFDLGEGTLSTEAIANPPPFERLRAAVFYDEIARGLISRYKFSDRSDMAPFIANVMRRAGSELIRDADLIVPLPLHWRRLHVRRFNQSAELAKIICQSEKKPYAPMVLVRKKHTKQQIGLSREARRANVAGAFIVPAQKRVELKGKRVLLIDDVYTSGASVKVATKALLRADARAVDVLTFAKVHSDII